MSNQPSLTYADLKALNPCVDSLRRVTRLLGGKWKHKITAAEAVAAGATYADIAWAASRVARHDEDVERRVRLWLTDCAAHVLHIYERAREGDDRPRNAIIAARQFARGAISAAAWDAAYAAACAAGAAAVDAARDAVWDAVWDAEEAWQFDRLVAWLSEPEPEDYPLPTISREVTNA